MLSTDQRLTRFIETLQPEDRLPEVVELMNRLIEHDPTAAGPWENLMLALAVVWDQPKQPLPHRQMGPYPLEYERDLLRRYDFFKELYASGKARIEYEKLSVNELIFTVSAPLPIAELEWARDHVGGSASGWKKKFSDIEYAQGRLMREEYSWPHGTYTLEKIQKYGGICVDQAYYATFSARANGIPAIYFEGMGNTMGHAWFSYMREPGKWDLDVGRYEESRFTTGRSLHPQTGRALTDHDVEYLCEYALTSEAYAEARRLTRISRVLLRAGNAEGAAACAHEARKTVPRYEAPWQIELRALEQTGQTQEAVELLKEKADVFGKYSDILAETELHRARLLREDGETEEADRVLRDLISKVRSDGRDDLVRKLTARQVEHSDDPVQARKAMEKLLDSQIDAGSKLRPLIRDYLTQTKESGQTREAAKFMEGYIEKLHKMYGWQMTPSYEKGLLQLLKTAYQNAGDPKGAAEVNDRMSEID
jgi:tetratricopeptide (TPR) repeat protein